MKTGPGLTPPSFPGQDNPFCWRLRGLLVHLPMGYRVDWSLEMILSGHKKVGGQVVEFLLGEACHRVIACYRHSRPQLPRAGTPLQLGSWCPGTGVKVRSALPIFPQIGGGDAFNCGKYTIVSTIDISTARRPPDAGARCVSPGRTIYLDEDVQSDERHRPLTRSRASAGACRLDSTPRPNGERA